MAIFVYSCGEDDLKHIETKPPFTQPSIILAILSEYLEGMLNLRLKPKKSRRKP